MHCGTKTNRIMTPIEIEKYLTNEGISCEIFVYPNNENLLDVNIDWGDWKHDHKYCDYLMEKIGWELESECVSDDDGSDCYSATHTYKRKN